MNALVHLARRGGRPRHERSPAAAHGPAPTAATTSPSRLGPGQGRDLSPVPPGPSPGARRLDPRWYQIAMLSSLLAYGMWGVGFDVGWGRIAGVIGAALATQYLCTKLWRLRRFDPLSALISGIGLCTLLRTEGAAAALFAAALAIGSKFVLRWHGKHLYNPTNLALVVMLVAGAGWISPGQYGHVAFVALLMWCMGLMVVCKAARSDVTLAFLGAYAAILFGRSLWLGEPMTIPIHRLQSGLLLQFAFNMISDPRTTPDSRSGRVLFGALVAVGAGIVQFVMFRTNGPVWSLAACTLLVPLLDRWLPGPRHQWKPIAATAGATERGVIHETLVPVPAFAAGAGPAAVRHALAVERP